MGEQYFWVDHPLAPPQMEKRKLTWMECPQPAWCCILWSMSISQGLGEPLPTPPQVSSSEEYSGHNHRGERGEAQGPEGAGDSTWPPLTCKFPDCSPLPASQFILRLGEDGNTGWENEPREEGQGHWGWHLGKAPYLSSGLSHPAIEKAPQQG